MQRGLLSSFFAGAALAGGSSNAVHPFAKYKSLALGADTATSVTTSVPAPTPLECFQVAEPVLTPSGVTRRDTSQPPALLSTDQTPIEAASDDDDRTSSSCSVILMNHTFANSYGAPYVGTYEPPSCEFDYVVINFTTVVKGRQFDRTGVMYLGDNEVWRTSTAEPTTAGIRWEWLKDVTPFVSLWKQPQTLIFDLENIVDSTYTGLLNTTLTATFLKTTEKLQGNYPPADLVIPISQRISSSASPSQFVYPGQAAVNNVTDFPRNANRAVFTVDVKGQGNEEFWWSNVLQSAAFTFNATYGEYPGYSPFREVQVLIDGHLAGVSWPYPVIYTGGVVPQLNRPIVGVQAFDISEHEIDVSPFLPLLCDGNAHTFEIKVLGLVDDGGSSAALSTTTDDEWYITGKIFVWLDDEASITTGTVGNLTTTAPIITLSQRLTQDATGANESLEYNLQVSRTVAISSHVKTQKTSGSVTWSQLLTYSNKGGVSNYGNNNLNTFSISGSDSSKGPATTYATKYEYPLFSNSTLDVTAEGNLTLWAQVDQGLSVQVRGDSVFPTGLEAFVATGAFPAAKKGGTTGSVVSTWRNGTANYYAPGDNSYSTGVGSTHQIYTFSGINSAGHVEELYYRDVSAYNNTVTADHVNVTQ